MKAKIWNENDRIEKIKLEIKMLKETNRDPFEIVAKTYDAIKRIIFDSIKEENPNILFEDLLKKARDIVKLGRRDL